MSQNEEYITNRIFLRSPVHSGGEVPVPPPRWAISGRPVGAAMGTDTRVKPFPPRIRSKRCMRRARFKAEASVQTNFCGNSFPSNVVLATLFPHETPPPLNRFRLPAPLARHPNPDALRRKLAD